MVPNWGVQIDVLTPSLSPKEGLQPRLNVQSVAYPFHELTYSKGAASVPQGTLHALQGSTSQRTTNSKTRGKQFTGRRQHNSRGFGHNPPKTVKTCVLCCALFRDM